MVTETVTQPPRLCKQCKKPLPPQTTGRPRLYHEECRAAAGKARTEERATGMGPVLDEFRSASEPVTAAATTVLTAIGEFKSALDGHAAALGEVETTALAYAADTEQQRAEFAQRMQEAEAAAVSDREATATAIRRQRQAEEDRAAAVQAMEEAEARRKADVAAAQQRAEDGWRAAGDAQAAAAAATERAEAAAAALEVAREAQIAAEERVSAAETDRNVAKVKLTAVKAANDELQEALTNATAHALELQQETERVRSEAAQAQRESAAALADVQAKLAAAEAETQSLTTANAVQAAQLETAERAQADLRAHLTELTAAINANRVDPESPPQKP